MSNAVLPNFCKNCFKPLPKSLQYCSKSCIDEIKFKEKNPSSFGVTLTTEELSYTEVDNLFTKYANSEDKEREKLGKIIDDNYELSKEYIEAVKLAYETEPNMPKFSFKEWLKWKNKTTEKTFQTAKETLSHA